MFLGKTPVSLLYSGAGRSFPLACVTQMYEQFYEPPVFNRRTKLIIGEKSTTADCFVYLSGYCCNFSARLKRSITHKDVRYTLSDTLSNFRLVSTLTQFH